MSRLTDALSMRKVSPVRRALTACLLGIVLGVLFLLLSGRVGYYEVRSGSMEPTIMIGDRLIVSRMRSLARGDIVVFHKTGQSSEALVKRLVALGPDMVEQREGQLYVNGTRNDPPEGPVEESPDEDHVWKLKPAEAFVAGDDREISKDSRTFGPIPLDSIEGIVTYRIGPKGRRGVL